MKWLKTVDIKVVLNDDDLILSEKAERIERLVRDEMIPTLWHPDRNLPMLDEALEFIANAVQDDDEDEFDEGLTLIYDVADDEQIWMGL